MKQIMLHICCAPCAIYPLQRLRAAGFDVTGVFYNHNIHPYKEYMKRLETVRLFAAEEKMPLIEAGGYEMELFLENVALSWQQRCLYCYESRLEKAAILARDSGIDIITTSLLVSPFQKHEIIAKCGEKIAAAQGIKFYYEDFRTGWNEGTKLSRERGYYRQGYCGCIYSEKERYCK